MFSFPRLFIACSAVAGAFAATIPSNGTVFPKRTTVSSSQTGAVDDTWYSLYIETNQGAELTINESNEFSLSWESSAVDVVAGIGWSTGSAQSIEYSGSLSASGTTYLSVYGWFTNPLVEYYIMDSWEAYNPGSAGTLLGSVTSDGGTYDIYETTRTNAPSIDGTQTFHQYLSIRTSNRVGGTITTANHFNAWKSLGLQTGTFNYQILAVEGYESSGSASFTVY